MTYFNQNKAYITPEFYYTICRVGKRIVFAPCDELKKVQRYFKQALEWTYPLKISTFYCAKIHCGKKWILKMDIKDFYASVQYEFTRQVVKNICKKIKLADINYYLNVTTLNDKLPVGAPTSAHIANACFSPVDKRIRTYCRTHDVNYSRYMDDLIFSSDDKFSLNMAEKFVKNVLEVFSYKLNEKKTKYISDNKQQNVLGLVVNGKQARLPKKLRKRLRAMLHGYMVYKTSGATPVDFKYRTWSETEIARLKGYLAYTKQADNETFDKLEQYLKQLYAKSYISKNPTC